MEILFGFNHHKSKVFLLVALLMTLVRVYFLREGDYYWPWFVSLNCSQFLCLCVPCIEVRLLHNFLFKTQALNLIRDIALHEEIYNYNWTELSVNIFHFSRCLIGRCRLKIFSYLTIPNKLNGQLKEKIWLTVQWK